MIRALHALAVSVSIGMLAACSAHTVELDRNLPTAAPIVAGMSELGSIERVDMGRDVWAFYVQGPRIFWQSNGFYSCEFERCRDTLVTYDVPSTSTLIGATAADVFFSHDGISYPYSSTDVIARCPWSGCSGGAQNFLQDDKNAGWGPAFDADYFYWQSTYDVLRCPLTGCGAVPELVARNQTGTGTVLGVGADSVFYSPLETTSPLQWELRSAPKDGSAPPTTIAQSPVSSYLFAVGPAAVYWLESTGGIKSCPLSGCDGKPPITLVSTATTKLALRVDEAGVYWTEAADENQVVGSVRICPLTGCAAGQEAITLGSGNLTRQFELDAKYIYWTNYASGPAVQLGPTVIPGATSLVADSYIYRMPKPQPAH
jgi:hypothetical protein